MCNPRYLSHVLECTISESLLFLTFFNPTWSQFWFLFLLCIFLPLYFIWFLLIHMRVPVLVALLLLYVVQSCFFTVIFYSGFYLYYVYECTIKYLILALYFYYYTEYSTSKKKKNWKEKCMAKNAELTSCSIKKWGIAEFH